MKDVVNRRKPYKNVIIIIRTIKIANFKIAYELIQFIYYRLDE